jgi:DMSO/TMAO reductase YedYZ molybdopterin-dependent catalytic subunit
VPATETSPSARRTNLALLLALGVAVVTGAVSYATGTRWARWPVTAHGMAGLAIVLLAPWKAAFAGRARRRAGYDRASSVMLAVLVAVTVISGILFVTAGRGLRYGPFNAMQVHVGAALLAIPLAVHHIVSHRLLPRRTDLSRRNLLRVAGLGGAAAVTYGVVEGVNRVLGLPGGGRRFTGSYEVGSGGGAFPTTQWFNDSVPEIRPEEWRLTVDTGSRIIELSLADLSSTTTVTAVLDCTSGWYSEQAWRGVPLADLMGDADGNSIVVRSATGYSRRFPRSDADGLLLATHLGGDPLSAGHGAPARLVAPGRRGFWWVKWVVAVEVSDRSWWLQPPFPLT